MLSRRWNAVDCASLLRINRLGIVTHGPSPHERTLANQLIRAIARRAGPPPLNALIAACAALPVDDEEEALLLAAA